MKYKRGDIVIVKFPFIIKEKGKEQKGRPALVISDDRVTRRYRDAVLAAITSQIPPNVMELEMVLEPNEMNGLMRKSLLRLDFLMTVPDELISRKIGEISKGQLLEVESRLKKMVGI